MATTLSDTDKLTVAAHLYVLMRRKTGRAADVEWRVRNADYARRSSRDRRSVVQRAP